MRWRLLCDPPGSAAWNMSVDETLLLGCVESGPVLRLYAWREPSVSLGYRQKLPEWLARARELGVPCVRRVTGGGSVLHGGDLTYAVAAPRGCTDIPGDMRGSYEWIRARLLEGLCAAGIEAQASRGERRAATMELCFAASTGLEIEASGSKLVGSAQRRTRSAFLQHGSIRLRDESALERALFGRETTLPPQGALDAEQLRAAIVRAFEAAIDAQLEAGELTCDERTRARLRTFERERDPLGLPALSLRTAPASADRFP